MAETKKVIAVVSNWDNKLKNGLLVAKDVSPDIFLNFATLQQKKSTNLNPKKGDEFEVEIQSTMYKGKSNWTIISMKAMTKKLILENFALKLYKENIFENGNFKIEQRLLKKRSEDFQWIFGDNDDEQVKKYYQNFAKRHQDNAKILTNSQLKVQFFKPDWRLAIGLGSGSVFETSICLHHIYGFPYIPASAVKGVLRSHIITTLFGEDESENEPLLNAEFRAFQNNAFCKIFGCPDKFEEITFDKNGIPQLKKDGKYKMQKLDVNAKDDKDKGKAHAGNLIFFDAYPIHSPKDCIKADIMNPHYPDYYGNKNLPPADWQSPIPIIFLTVENLKFQFMVGLRKGVQNINIELGDKNGDMLSVVSDFLKEALTNKGIGAKTAVGYGYMSE